jgi:predicted anti-sigma-YlaC factor YlaD
VRCADCREELSARLDGEDDPTVRSSVDVHLAGCAACRRWFDDAARVTRLTRTGVAVPTPDLVAAVRAHRPVRSGRRLRPVFRAVLALAGTGQLALAVAQILGDRFVGGAEMDGASMIHLMHESAAWNLALGVGFGWVAWRVRRAAGLVPTLTAFVLVLCTLAGLDFAHGRVDPARLSSHALVLVGYVAMLVLAAPDTRGGGFFPAARRRRGGWLGRSAAGSAAVEPDAAGEHRDGTDLRPTAHRQVA